VSFLYQLDHLQLLQRCPPAPETQPALHKATPPRPKPYSTILHCPRCYNNKQTYNLDSVIRRAAPTSPPSSRVAVPVARSTSQYKSKQASCAESFLHPGLALRSSVLFCWLELSLAWTRRSFISDRRRIATRSICNSTTRFIRYRQPTITLRSLSSIRT